MKNLSFIRKLWFLISGPRAIPFDKHRALLNDAVLKAKEETTEKFLVKKNELLEGIICLAREMQNHLSIADLNWSEIFFIETKPDAASWPDAFLFDKGFEGLLVCGIVINMRYKSSELTHISLPLSNIQVFSNLGPGLIGKTYFEVRPEDKTIFLNKIDVTEGYENLGIGTKMLQMLIFFAKQTGMKKIKALLLSKRKPETDGFYRKNGFEIVRCDKSEYAILKL